VCGRWANDVRDLRCTLGFALPASSSAGSSRNGSDVTLRPCERTGRIVHSGRSMPKSPLPLAKHEYTPQNRRVVLHLFLVPIPKFAQVAEVEQPVWLKQALLCSFFQLSAEPLRHRHGKTLLLTAEKSLGKHGLDRPLEDAFSRSIAQLQATRNPSG